MAWKLVVITVVVISTTTWKSPLRHEMETGSLPDELVHQRQNFDVFAPTMPTKLQIEEADLDAVTMPYALLGGDAVYDSDMPYQAVDFNSSHVEELLSKGVVSINLPAQQAIELTLLSTSRQHGVQSIRVEHAGLISTISRRHDNLFATIATPQESYRVQRNNGVSRLFAHRVLAQRSIRHHKDYKYVH